MSDVRVDSITDDDGDTVEVSHLGTVVVLRTIERESGHIQEVFLNAARRDRFAKAYAEAERRAEAPQVNEPPRPEQG